MKNFNLQKIQVRDSYTSREILDKLGCSIGSLRLWTKKGLKPKNPGSTPFWFLGQDLFDFLAAQKESTKFKCGPDELPCFTCHKGRKCKPETREVIKTDIRQGNKGKYKLIRKGVCEVCGRKLSRVGTYEKAGVAEYDLGIKNAVEPVLLTTNK